jgi:hypothetical protein
MKRNSSYEVLLRKLQEIYPQATIDFLKKNIGNMRTAFKRTEKSKLKLEFIDLILIM